MLPSSVATFDARRQRVRCVLHSRATPSSNTSASALSLADTCAFLRGVAALYGDGLDVEVADAVASSSDPPVAQAPEAASGNAAGDSACAATIMISDVNDQQLQHTVVLHGQAAITQWMKALLETRLQSSGSPQADSSIASPLRAQPVTAATESRNDEPIRIFVSGDRSQVGKSTVCLGLVGALLRHGFAPQDIAYIKPATQCEAPQLVAKFCHEKRIACCDIGPIVFYSGFTREFLKGNTEPPETLLAMAKAKMDEIGRGKKVVVVDGVGYPAVGSICGVSNAAVAFAVQAPVVLVGKRGVGDAVDSFNLNACFFESQGVKVLGALFNRLPQDGYYSLENCRESVTEYFEQFQPEKQVYGFIPEMEQVPEGGDAEEAESADAPCDGDGENGQEVARMPPQEARQAKRVIDTFYEHVNLSQLLRDAEQHQSCKALSSEPGASAGAQSAKRPHPSPGSVNEPATNGDAGIVKRSRAEIQAAAKASGAAGG